MGMGDMGTYRLGDNVGYLAKRAVATVTIDYGFFDIADNLAS